LRPLHAVPRLLAEAFRKGFRAGRENLPAMLALDGAIVVVVLLYYFSPGTRPFFVRLAAWQHQGGILAAAIGNALAGGVLAEVSAVYVQRAGRWTRAHLENMALNSALFFFLGSTVFEFYRFQAFLFGDSPSPSAVVPKVLVDQLGYTVVFSAPVSTLVTRWHALGFSLRALRHELATGFIPDRFLPVLVTNWMFWFPAVALIYAMPLALQVPLAIFATAIWGLLLTAAARQSRHLPTVTPQDLLPGETTTD
jgi:hypothetical protein